MAEQRDSPQRMLLHNEEVSTRWQHRIRPSPLTNALGVDYIFTSDVYKIMKVILVDILRALHLYPAICYCRKRLPVGATLAVRHDSLVALSLHGSPGHALQFLRLCQRTLLTRLIIIIAAAVVVINPFTEIFVRVSSSSTPNSPYFLSSFSI